LGWVGLGWVGWLVHAIGLGCWVGVLCFFYWYCITDKGVIFGKIAHNNNNKQITTDINIFSYAITLYHYCKN